MIRTGNILLQRTIEASCCFRKHLWVKRKDLWKCKKNWDWDLMCVYFFMLIYLKNLFTFVTETHSPVSCFFVCFFLHSCNTNIHVCWEGCPLRQSPWRIGQLIVRKFFFNLILKHSEQQLLLSIFKQWYVLCQLHSLFLIDWRMYRFGHGLLVLGCHAWF